MPYRHLFLTAISKHHIQHIVQFRVISFELLWPFEEILRYHCEKLRIVGKLYKYQCYLYLVFAPIDGKWG